MAALSILLGLLAVVLTYGYLKLFYRKRKPGEPPIVPGHFIWGNGKQFMKHAVKFLSQSCQKHGDVFTIRFINQYLTLVLDVHSYELFAREKNFDFEPITKQVNGNVFGYTLFKSKKMISQAGQKVNGKYLFTTFESFANSLTDCFNQIILQDNTSINKVDSTVKNNMKNKDKLLKNENKIDQLLEKRTENYVPLTNSSKIVKCRPDHSNGDLIDGWREDNLRSLASKIFFSPVFYTIFGRGEPGKEGNFHPQVFHQNFDQFHKYFNFLWLGMPVNLFPKAVEAVGVLAQQPSSSEMIQRDGCSEYIKYATQFMLNHNQSERDIICHNLVFLHVNYNTFRVAYWLMYKLMENPAVMAAVRKEVQEVVAAKRTGSNDDVNEAEFTTDDINKLPIVDSFLKEVIRTTSGVFMVRVCTAETSFTTASGRSYNIRKGDKVAIYPPVFHHDPEIYTDPETFKYDRFVDAEFYKNGVKVAHPLIGFGSLCPGQKLSMLQLKWFIINVVNSFKIQLLEGETTSPNAEMYGHEILPPVRDVQCRFMPREGACALKFINKFGTNEV